MEKKRNPWLWIPSLYMAEGLPYVAVMTISVIMYKRLGISNTDIAFYTGWLYLPWVIKPFWSPFVDLVKTKRWWTVTMQFLIAIAFACIAFSLPTSFFFQLTLAAFWLVAFTSATHDIAADGYYMHALDDHEQSLYVGIRSTFYRIATVAGQGLLVILAGFLEERNGDIPFAWTVTFCCLSALFFIAALYHQYILPRPASDHAAVEITARSVAKDFIDTFKSFFTKPNALVAILFMLLYRLPEAQLVKLITPFMLDPVEKGGLGLTTTDVGFVYGTVGSRRYSSSAWRFEEVVMAYGLCHHSARPCVCLSELCPAGKYVHHQLLCLHRTVRLRIWFHSLHALPHLLLRGKSQNSPLCYLYRLYGSRYDASGYGSRMASGDNWLSAFLCLDHHLLSCHFRHYSLPED